MNSKNRIACLVTFCLLVLSCAGRKLRTDLPRNVSITSILKDSSNTVNAALFVFSIDSKCKWEQVAQYKLAPGTVDLGLPVGEKLALEFAFSATSMFSSNRQVSHQILFVAKDQAKYNIETSYNNGVYFVEVKEKAGGQKQGKIIERTDPNTCQPIG